jgi:hypothetical protein
MDSLLVQHIQTQQILHPYFRRFIWATYVHDVLSTGAHHTPSHFHRFIWATYALKKVQNRPNQVGPTYCRPITNSIVRPSWLIVK